MNIRFADSAASMGDTVETVMNRIMNHVNPESVVGGPIYRVLLLSSLTLLLSLTTLPTAH